MRLLLLVALLIFLAGVTSAHKSSQDLVLGVLEDVPARYFGQPDVREVRALFQKQGDEWKAFPSDCGDQNCLKTVSSSYPREVTWTIAFDGKSIGKLTGRTPNQFEFYSDIGLQQIVGEDPVPTIGKQSKEFGGALSAAVYRPLVAISQPNVADPDRWKRSQISPSVIAAVRGRFRQQFPKVTNCKNPDENVARPWAYEDENIKIAKTYSSMRNWSVVQVVLKPDRCDGPRDDEFADQWFLVTPNNEIEHLGDSMWLVDAGDYDRDGKSEALFSIAGDDVGGYLLYYDDFTKHASFEFSYH